MYSGLIIS
ncbi:uncharacterized protein FTOL_13681 [Fusarium torulosum]|uniref:Uncharacterized protein n=1 Tax=Fusarium torulosum TaxID=33205 RepID=A0AAE8SQ33_9HYPO|nr:uncharacterized protein FTOL_13681 [Fusarium torulosum]